MLSRTSTLTPLAISRDPLHGRLLATRHNLKLPQRVSRSMEFWVPDYEKLWTVRLFTLLI